MNRLLEGVSSVRKSLDWWMNCDGASLGVFRCRRVMLIVIVQYILCIYLSCRKYLHTVIFIIYLFIIGLKKNNLVYK